MDIEELKPIEVKSIRQPRKQSMVVNNFFTLITIAIMSIVIIWYVNFVLPQQKENKKLHEQNILKYNKLKVEQKKRQDQIDLARKLNAKP